LDGNKPVPTEVTEVTTFLAARKGIIGDGLGMDGSRAKNEGEGEDGGVVEGLGHLDGFVEAASRAGDGGGVAAGVLETEPEALPKEKSEATTPGSFKKRGSSSD
jgi:hypothetical protein